jgi:rSAM/selenodomain-associated transferase 2
VASGDFKQQRSIVNNLDNLQISIIIPVLNEVQTIAATLASIAGAIDVETIVVDGGSVDDTVGLVRSLGVRAISSEPGRAKQMNAGAKIATGEILLFLHADTCLPPNFDELIRTTLGSIPHSRDRSPIAGAFALQIDAPLPSLRWIERGVSWRSKWLQLPYGDQAIFLRKDTFDRLGGFPDLPIMEDFVTIRRLQSLGYIQTLSVPVLTSARRWLKRGTVQTTLMNQTIVLGYFLGVSPDRLAQWYRQPKLNVMNELWVLLVRDRSS